MDFPYTSFPFSTKHYTCPYDDNNKYVGFGLSGALLLLLIWTFIRACRLPAHPTMKKLYVVLPFVCICLGIIFRILSFLDPIITMCHGLAFEIFSMKRTAFFFTYDFPALCMMLATGFYGFSLLEFALAKKSHVPQGIGPKLWLSFVISFNILFFILFFLSIISTPSMPYNFSGVYASGMIIAITGIIEIALLIFASCKYASKSFALNGESPENNTIKSKVRAGALVTILAIFPYVGYLGYMTFAGQDILQRDETDLFIEFAFTGGFEILAVILIPIGISTQTEIHKLQADKGYRFYDQEKQEYVEGNENEDEEESKSNSGKRGKAKRADYIKSFALARSILMHKAN